MKWVIAAVLGLGVYLLLALLSAYLILEETIPQEWGKICLCISASGGAFVSGLVMSGGTGKLLRGCCAGVVCAFGILCVKGVCSADASWTISTTVMVACCIIFAGLGSCILHKTNKNATRKRYKAHHRK